MLNGHAAWTVAGFTVDQWQTGIFGDLIAVNRMFEIHVNFVVDVTALQAVFITDVVGVEIPCQEGLIIPDRCDRL